jgi:hypothetical protein
LSKCDNSKKILKLFIVRLPSSTGSEQAFDKLRANWLSLTLDFKPYVTLSDSRSVTIGYFEILKMFFRQASLRQAQGKLAQPDIRF